MNLHSNKTLIFSYRVERSLQRFRELIVYCSDRSKNDPDFGSVKLNKILYFSDFMAYERFGQPLTGVVYQKLEHGPAPRAMLHVRRELIDEGVISLKTVSVFGLKQQRTVAHRKAIMNLFFADEVALVDEVIESLTGQNAKDVSLRSHDLRWKSVHLGDDIPYDFIYLDTSELTPEDVKRSHELSEQLGW